MTLLFQVSEKSEERHKASDLPNLCASALEPLQGERKSRYLEAMANSGKATWEAPLGRGGSPSVCQDSQEPAATDDEQLAEGEDTKCEEEGGFCECFLKQEKGYRKQPACCATYF